MHIPSSKWNARNLLPPLNMGAASSPLPVYDIPPVSADAIPPPLLSVPTSASPTIATTQTVPRQRNVTGGPRGLKSLGTFDTPDYVPDDAMHSGGPDSPPASHDTPAQSARYSITVQISELDPARPRSDVTFTVGGRVKHRHWSYLPPSASSSYCGTFQAYRPRAPSEADRQAPGLSEDPAVPAVAPVLASSGTYQSLFYWRSRVSFLLACTGSAIGLGNFWRFPYLAYTYSGCTFFFVYLICLLTIGLPLAYLETVVGQRNRGSDVSAFARVHRRLRGIGCASAIASFLTALFYTVLIAWAVVYTYETFLTTLPWATEDAVVRAPSRSPFCRVNVTGAVTDNANYHFYYEVSGAYGRDCRYGDGSLGGGNSRFYSAPFAGFCVVWFVIWAILLYGGQTVSYAVWITVPIPFILLFILLLPALSLDGSSLGVQKYLSTFDISLLQRFPIWRDAATHVFFSLGVCYGVLTTYGSYLPPDQPVLTDLFIVCLCDTLFSFLSGFAVFGMFGHVALTENLPYEIPSAFHLGFVAFPAALTNRFPGISGHVLCIVLFWMLFLLGIDSAFAWMKAVIVFVADLSIGGVSVLQRLDRAFGPRYAFPIITTVSTTAMILCGFLVFRDVGFVWQDVIGHFVDSYVVIFIGILKVLACGWVWGWKDDVFSVGKRSAVVLYVSFFVCAFLWATTIAVIDMFSCSLCHSRNRLVTLGATLFFGLLFLLGALAAWRLDHSRPRPSFAFYLTKIGFSSISKATEFCAWAERDTHGIPWGFGKNWWHRMGACWRLYWGFLVKWILPQVLCLLLLVIFSADVSSRYGGTVQCLPKICDSVTTGTLTPTNASSLALDQSTLVAEYCAICGVDKYSTGVIAFGWSVVSIVLILSFLFAFRSVSSADKEVDPLSKAALRFRGMPADQCRGDDGYIPSDLITDKPFLRDVRAQILSETALTTVESSIYCQYFTRRSEIRGLVALVLSLAFMVVFAVVMLTTSV